jgi:alkylhydroperoxidase family enzyme
MTEEVFKMARIPFLTDEEANPEMRALFDSTRENYGRNLNVIRGLANHPEAANLIMQLIGVTYQSGSLPTEQQELTWIYTSHLNSCHY